MPWPIRASARVDGAASAPGAAWRRPLANAALALLALLYSSAIYAPLLASDLPYFLRGVDYKFCTLRDTVRTSQLGGQSSTLTASHMKCRNTNNP